MKKLFILLLLMLMLPLAFATLDDAALYYSFDTSDLDAAGNPLDISGPYEYHSVNNGSASAEPDGYINQAFNFTQSGSDYLDANLSTTIPDGSTNFTVCAWVQWDSLSGNMGIYGGQLGGTAGMNFWYQTGSGLSFTKTGTAAFTYSWTPNTSQWYHVCGLQTSAGQHIYVDGVLAATAATPSPGLDPVDMTGVNRMTVGARLIGGSADSFHDGAIDELAVYNRSLTPTEIGELYALTSNPYNIITFDDTLTIQAKDIDNSTSITTFNATIEGNSTVFTTTNGTIYINITESGGNLSLQNVTLTAQTYFSQTYTNWNISYALVANLTQYPRITTYDIWDNSSISNFTFQVDATNYSSVAGELYLPLNSSKAVGLFVPTYFNTTFTHDFSSATDLNQSMIQSEIKFVVTEIITNNTVSGNITIGGQTKTDTEKWYLKAGNYNAVFTATGYFPVNIAFTVSPLDNRTITTEGASGSIINITATQKFLGTTLSDFNITYEGKNITYSGTATASGTFYELAVLQGYEYNITVSHAGYITASQLFVPTTNNTPAAFELYANNRVQFNFFDEDTKLPILNVNYTLTSSDFGFQGSTTNGTVIINNLQTDRFGLEYESTNYTLRNYFFRIPIETDSDTNITAYLLSDTLASDFILTVTDVLGTPVSGLTVELLRRYVVDSQTVYEVVEMMEPSITNGGATRFTAEANYVPYLFRVYDVNNNLLSQVPGTTSSGNVEVLNLIDDQIYIKVSTTTSPFKVAENVDNFQYSLTQTNNNTFWFSYSDTNSIAERVSLKVYENGTKLIGSQSSASSSAILSVAFTRNNLSNYVAIGTVYEDDTGLEIPIDSLTIDRTQKEGVSIWGIMGWFLLFISLMVFTIAFASRLEIAIIFNVLAILAFSSQLLGLIAVSVAVQGSLFALGLVIMYVMRES